MFCLIIIQHICARAGKLFSFKKIKKSKKVYNTGNEKKINKNQKTNDTSSYSNKDVRVQNFLAKEK